MFPIQQGQGLLQGLGREQGSGVVCVADWTAMVFMVFMD